MRAFTTSVAVIFSAILAQTVSAEGISYVPIKPPSYPLAVRNPYLSVWVPGDQVENLPSAIPQFWDGTNMTWSISARVDGQTYNLMGATGLADGVQAATVLKAEYTATHTTFTLTAGNVNIVLDFFSPVAPLDYVRQSLPFSYFTVSVSNINGSTPDVQIYSDVGNSFSGQFGNATMSWSWDETVSNTQVLQLTPTDPFDSQLFAENSDMATWGTTVFCTCQPDNGNSDTVNHVVGDVYAVRDGFSTQGKVAGSADWTPGSVAAYSHDLGNISSTTNVTFAIGLWREAAVNYRGTQNRTGYFMSSCSDINACCAHVLDDFAAADAEGQTFDAEIIDKATNVAGSNYSDIVTLSVRQAFGAMDLTIPLNSLDTTDVLAFVKEISSDGNVNTVDVIYPMSPILYTLAPEYIRLLLEPLLRYSADGGWPNLDYSIHDLGTHYPNATGHRDGDYVEEMPLEESGDLILMVAAYHSATGNTEWMNQYYSLLQRYADYLVQNGLYPTLQLSSDDFGGTRANQTSLAVKSAVALNAFGQMYGMSNYSDIGKDFANTLYNDGAGLDSNRTHFTFIQGQDDSWHLEYNLFFDVLLNLSTFPTEAYSMASAYYSSVRSPGGVALDSEVSQGKTDWMMFAASIAMASGVGNTDARDMFIDDVHQFLTTEGSPVPFCDLFYIRTNESIDQYVDQWAGFRNRPVVGGHFALMAMGGPGQMADGLGGSTATPTS
ncbi:DUF1793-domain-containing protein [Teratosphaeria nubilosa]|uniref:DUF1793-domain-containing protein n=1 Tax=Teratosphaeria nubilosa TaxID=161662 RepID=A0A6G1L1F1_9PEZI|nr:DUF1793-domain-containing protein [Teratosphaeria nubilosa]